MSKSMSQKLSRFKMRIELAKSILTRPWGRHVRHHAHLSAALTARDHSTSTAPPDPNDEHVLALILFGSSKAEIERLFELYLTLTHRVSELEQSLADKTLAPKSGIEK